MRVGSFTAKYVKLFKSSLITNDDSNFKGALRLFPTIAEVNKYNNALQHSLENNVNCVIITAEHDLSDGEMSYDQAPIENFIPIDDRDAGGLPLSLCISKGTRVMLIRNMATDHGMVNGLLGFVSLLEVQEDGVSLRIHINFDDELVGRIYKT